MMRCTGGTRRVDMSVALLAGFCIASQSVDAADLYTAIDLYPLGHVSTSGAPEEFAAGGQVVGTVSGNATVWTSSGTPINLTPTNLGGTWVNTLALSTNGSQQVGSGELAASAPPANPQVALMWNGSAGSAVNLNPTNINVTTSAALGTSGTQQVGWGSGPDTASQPHALLWSGTPGSAVDLNPATFPNSIAYATNGSHQVGAGAVPSAGGQMHALVWSGSAASFVDLSPGISGLSGSFAYGISPSGTQQVGQFFTPGGHGTAIVWNGTALSGVPLDTPAPFNASEAVGTNGIQQVGIAFKYPVDMTQPLIDHAWVWSGTTASGIDLHSFLPSSFTDSQACSIDATGDIFGTASGLNGTDAIEWVPVPEPSVLALLGVAALVAARCRRARP